MQLDDGSFHDEVQSVPDHLAGKGEGLEALLVHEVETSSVAVQVGCLDHLEVRLLEPVAGLECLVKNCPCEKVAHLQADQGLAALAVGVETSTSRHTNGVFSNSKNILRFTSMASISAAMISSETGPEAEDSTGVRLGFPSGNW